MSAIVTDYVRPPLPTTMYDWVAYIKDDEDCQRWTGRGPTESEALRDLAEKMLHAMNEREAA